MASKINGIEDAHPCQSNITGPVVRMTFSRRRRVPTDTIDEQMVVDEGCRLLGESKTCRKLCGLGEELNVYGFGCEFRTPFRQILTLYVTGGEGAVEVAAYMILMPDSAHFSERLVILSCKNRRGVWTVSFLGVLCDAC